MLADCLFLAMLVAAGTGKNGVRRGMTGGAHQVTLLAMIERKWMDSQPGRLPVGRGVAGGTLPAE